jgi:hypothetical protein
VIGKKPKSDLDVRFFPTDVEEHAQRMQAICNISIERQGHGERIRKPSGSMRVCIHLHRRVTRFFSQKRVEFYHQLETWS